MEPLTPVQMESLLAATQAKNPGDSRVTMDWLKSQPPEVLQASWQRVQQGQSGADQPGQEGIVGGLKDLGNAVVHPVRTAEGIGRFLYGLPQDLANIITGPPNWQVAPPQPGGNEGVGLPMYMRPSRVTADQQAQYGQSLQHVLGTAAGLSAGAPGAIMGGEILGGTDPLRGATAAAVPLGLAKVAGITAGAVAPEAAAMRNAMRRVQGIDPAEMMAQRARIAATGREGVASVADLVPGVNGQPGPLQSGLAEAVQRSQALANRLRSYMEERGAGASNARMIQDLRGQLGNPSVAEIDAGLAAARKSFSDPTFQAVRDNAPDVSFARDKSITVSHVMGPDATVAGRAALEQALKTDRNFNTWWNNKIANQSFTPADLSKAIPGTGGKANPIAEILRDTETAKEIPRGVKVAMSEGRAVPFGDLMDTYQNLDWATNKAFKAGDNALGVHLSAQRTALGDAMGTMESSWAEANMGFRRLARQQEAFYRGVEAFKQGKPTDITDVLRQEPVVAENPAAFQRGMQSAMFEKMGGVSQGATIAKMFSPSGPFSREMLPLVLPDQMLSPLQSAARVERGMGAMPATVGGDAAMGMPYVSSNKLAMISKLLQKFSVPLVRRGTADALGEILSATDPAKLDAFLARVSKR